MAVEYENEYAGKFRTALSDTAVSHVIPVARLRADTAYEYAVGVEKRDETLAYGARGAFVAGAISAFPTMRSEARGRSSQSLILADYRVGFYDNASSTHLIMWDELGEPVWIYEASSRRSPSRGSVHHILPNGNIMYISRGEPDNPDARALYEITPLGELVNKKIIDGGESRAHHDFIALDDGRILYIGRYHFTFDDSANGGDAETPTRVDTLNIYDPATETAERVWDPVKFWDIRDPAQRGEWFKTSDLFSWLHLNSLSRAPDGGYIASSRNLHQVISISPDFQTVRWRLGGPGGDFDFPDPADRFHAQHTATQLPGGSVLVFDNRAELPGGGGSYSRALELRLDFDAMTAVKAWEFSPDPPIYSSVVSSAYRLDNGNTLVNFGTTEDLATIPIAIIEANAEGREIFRLETIDPAVAEEASLGPWRYRAYPGPDSVIGETTLRAPKPMR